LDQLVFPMGRATQSNSAEIETKKPSQYFGQKLRLTLKRFGENETFIFTCLDVPTQAFDGTAGTVSPLSLHNSLPFALKPTALSVT